jgi:hypothetical protein
MHALARSFQLRRDVFCETFGIDEFVDPHPFVRKILSNCRGRCDDGMGCGDDVALTACPSSV